MALSLLSKSGQVLEFVFLRVNQALSKGQLLPGACGAVTEVNLWAGVCIHMCMSCCRTEMGIEEKDSRQWAPDLRLYDCSGPQMIEIDLSHSHRPGLMSKGWVLGMFSHHSFCSLCRFQPQKLPRFSFSVTHLSTDGALHNQSQQLDQLLHPLPPSSPHCLQE